MANQPLKVIVVGATSGIGAALAEQYALAGHQVGVCGRRLDPLETFHHKYLGKAFIKQMDLRLPEQAILQLEHLITQMKGVDLLIFSAGVGYINPTLDWDKEKQTIAVNVNGFSAIASTALKHFIRQKKGQLVCISSINALRGSDAAPAYGASKAYMSNYLQGLRKKMMKLRLPITVTEIQPGFVDTDMAKGNQLFWVSPVEKAAKQIIRAIELKRRHAYISRRWRLVGWALKLMPDWLYHRI